MAETIQLIADNSSVMADLNELSHMLTLVPSNRTERVGEALNAISELLDGDCAIDVKSRPDQAGNLVIHLEFTQEFRELASALRTALHV